MTPFSLEEFKRLAEAATEGPWENHYDEDEPSRWVAPTVDKWAICFLEFYDDDSGGGFKAKNAEHDAALIAFCGTHRDEIIRRLEVGVGALAAVRGLVDAARAVDQSPWCNTDPPYTHWHVSDKEFSRLRQALAAFEPFRKEFEDLPGPKKGQHAPTKPEVEG